MLLNQWRQFTEEQIRSVYPFQQVETTFGVELIKKGYVLQKFTSFNPFFQESSLLDSFLSVDNEAYFIATGGVSSHKDDGFAQYGYHLVLVNTGLIAKGVDQSSKLILPQEPGTVVILNNWELHHCIEDLRRGTIKPPIWVSVCFDNDAELPQKEVIKAFNRFLEEL